MVVSNDRGGNGSFDCHGLENMQGIKKMTSGVKTAKSVENRVVSLLDQGWSYRDIARATHVNLVTVTRISKQSGRSRSRKHFATDGVEDIGGLPDLTEKEASSLIYVIGCKELPFVKIGYSGSVSLLISRVNTGQTYCPFALEIIVAFSGTLKDEKRLHRRFSAFRVRGEWFTRSEEIEEFISRRQKESTFKAWELGKMSFNNLDK